MLERDDLLPLNREENSSRIHSYGILHPTNKKRRREKTLTEWKGLNRYGRIGTYCRIGMPQDTILHA